MTISSSLGYFWNSRISWLKVITLWCLFARERSQELLYLKRGALKTSQHCLTGLWVQIRNTFLCGIIRIPSRWLGTIMRERIWRLWTLSMCHRCVSLPIYWPILVKYELSFSLQNEKGNIYLCYIFTDKLIIIKFKSNPKKRKALILNLSHHLGEIKSFNSDIFVDEVYKQVIISLNLKKDKKSKLYTWSFNSIFKLFKSAKQLLTNNFKL